MISWCHITAYIWVRPEPFPSPLPCRCGCGWWAWLGGLVINLYCENPILCIQNAYIQQIADLTFCIVLLKTSSRFTHNSYFYNLALFTFCFTLLKVKQNAYFGFAGLWGAPFRKAWKTMREYRFQRADFLEHTFTGRARRAAQTWGPTHVYGQ